MQVVDFEMAVHSGAFSGQREEGCSVQAYSNS